MKKNKVSPDDETPHKASMGSETDPVDTTPATQSNNDDNDDVIVFHRDDNKMDQNELDEFKDVPRLIVKLVGDFSDKENNKKVYNIRYFLSVLVKLLINEECSYAVNENDKNLYYCVTDVTKVTIAKYKTIDKVQRKMSTILENKNIKECIVLCNGTENTIEEVQRYVKQDKAIVVLKGTGGLSDILAYAHENISAKSEQPFIVKMLRKIPNQIGDLNKLAKIIHTRYKGERGFEVIDTNKILNEQMIAQVILKALFDACKCPQNKRELNFLCIRLNVLEVGNEYGEFFKVAKKDETDTEDSEINRREILKQVIKYAVKLNRLKFIGYLMEQGLQLHTVIEAENLFQCLYFHFCICGKKEQRKNVENDICTDCCDVQTKGNDDYLCENCHKNIKREQSLSENKDDPLVPYFTEAIRRKQFAFSFIVWKFLQKPTIAALYAIEMINEMKSLVDEENIDEIDKLNEQIKLYEDRALKTLRKTYEKIQLRSDQKCNSSNSMKKDKEISSRNTIFNLLMYSSKEWNNSCCIVLAMKNNLNLFLSEIPCRKFNKKLWRNGYIDQSTDQLIDMKNYQQHGGIKLKIRTILSPSVVTLFQGMSRGVFLILYAMWLVSVLDVGTFHWLEFLLWTWIVCYGLELANQCFRNPIRRDVSSWNVFNYMEAVALALFLMSCILRYVAFSSQYNTAWMDWARVVYSVDFMIYALMSLEYCYTNQFLGPKLIIILKMTKVLTQFLLIILAFFLSFAVASQAVLYPNSKMNSRLAFHILKRPFWSVFGEFALDDLDSNTADCTTDPSLYNTYTQLRCPSQIAGYIVPVLMGLYVIIVNILLFNLLIALFNSDINIVEKRGEKIWNHQSMVFTFQQSKTIFLPPPFTILSPLLFWCRAKDANEPFSRTEIPGDKSLIDLRHLETEQRDLYVEENNEAGSTNTSGPITVDCTHKDNMNDDSEINGRIENMDQKLKWIQNYLLNNGNPEANRSITTEKQLKNSEQLKQSSSRNIEVQVNLQVPRTVSVCCQTEKRKKSYVKPIDKKTRAIPNIEAVDVTKDCTDLDGRVTAFPVSPRANEILNSTYSADVMKRFFAVKTRYKYGSMWTIHGVKQTGKRTNRDSSNKHRSYNQEFPALSDDECYLQTSRSENANSLIKPRKKYFQ